MLTLQGAYNSALVFTDEVDSQSMKQIIALCNQSFVRDSQIRIMPDVHAGAGCTIGTTMTITDKVCPNLVGVDIGCGVEIVKIEEDEIKFDRLDRLIEYNIPYGFGTRVVPHKYSSEVNLFDLKCRANIRCVRAANSLGTLGGGNHYIEVDKDEDGALYIVVHTGSRHLGLEVANYYQEAAYKEMCAPKKEDIDALIVKLKANGQSNMIQKELRKLASKFDSKTPKHLAYAQGELFHNYIHDMKIIQKFAALNRKAILDEILSGLRLHEVDRFSSVHNYIDTDSMILRKGAVSAREGERLIIPMNMRDGALLCTGKGNPAWNYSAPHGAGRLYSRSAANGAFTVAEFKEAMEGVYSTCINHNTLDECPMAYKNMESIVSNIGPAVSIDKIIKPVYNFKAK